MENNTDLEKRKRILEEEKRLSKQFSDIDKNKKILLKSIIADAAFCAVTMEELRDNIMRDGVSVDYQNGENQHGTKTSPDAAMYLKLSQRLSVATKILLDSMPKIKVAAPDDNFEDFVSEREKM